MGRKNARIPKGTDPKDLTLEKCLELLGVDESKGKKGKKAAKGKKVAKTADVKKTTAKPARPNGGKSPAKSAAPVKTKKVVKKTTAKPVRPNGGKTVTKKRK